jgi:hypothetical protein
MQSCCRAIDGLQSYNVSVLNQLLSYTLYIRSIGPRMSTLTSCSCRCGLQFCYVCGIEWKKCRCPQWDEPNLMIRANQVVARERPDENAEARVVAVVENLRTRHNCGHANWRFVRGSHRCEECLYTLPTYIFECVRCALRACNQCKLNRL